MNSFKQVNDKEITRINFYRQGHRLNSLGKVSSLSFSLPVHFCMLAKIS